MKHVTTSNLSFKVLLVIFFADIGLWYFVVNLQCLVSHLHWQTYMRTHTTCALYKCELNRFYSINFKILI